MSRQSSAYGVLIVMAFVAVSTVYGASAAKDADFYVSPDGNDDWSGELAEPNSAATDGPFATPRRARDAVRELIQTRGLTKPIKVLIRGGTYRISAPITLGPQDSGRSWAPVTYAAYPGEQPVISGGRRVTGWEKREDGLWVAHIQDVEDGEWYFRQFFVDGERRQRARMPNEGEGYFFVEGLVKPDQRQAAVNRNAFRYKSGDIDPGWTNLDDVEIVKFFGWNAARLSVDSVDADKRICRVDVPCSKVSRRLFTW